MRVNILLTTYQGGHYLAEQLESIVAQTYTDWSIHVSDDGSQDETLSILKDFQARLGEDRVKIYTGPRQGFAANFMSLMMRPDLSNNVANTSQAQDIAYYAYADQDDQWLPEKLERAVAWLQTQPTDQPLLYCGRTTLVDQHLNPMGLSPLFKKSPHFLNAWVQNIGGGNTMVFNDRTLQLLRETADISQIVAHDWWTYLLVTGAEGSVHYDPTPQLLYRQHPHNLIGGNIGWAARLHRIRLLFQGRLSKWIDAHIQALSAISYVLTPNNQQILQALIAMRQLPIFPRLLHMKKLGIFRQTPLGNLGLWVGALFNKI